MLVPDRACLGVDHADRIVVVVGDDERAAVGGDVHPAGVGLHVDADAAVPRAAGGARRIVAEGNRRRRSEAVAALRIHVHRVVIAAGGVECVPVG